MAQFFSKNSNCFLLCLTLLFSFQSLALNKQTKVVLAVSGYAGKVVLDAVNVWLQSDQYKDITKLQSDLSLVDEEDCSPVCVSNIDEFNNNAAEAKIADGFGMFFSGLSFLAAASGIPTYFLAQNHAYIPALLSLAFTGLNLVTLFAANGYLWDLSLHFTDDIPNYLISDLNEAMKEGIAPLAITGFSTITGVVVFVVYLIYTSREMPSDV